jgi:hypothetical protein
MAANGLGNRRSSLEYIDMLRPFGYGGHQEGRPPFAERRRKSPAYGLGVEPGTYPPVSTTEPRVEKHSGTAGGAPDRGRPNAIMSNS